MPLSPDQIDAVLAEEAAHECPGVGSPKVCVRMVAIADLPTRFGTFQIAAFWNNRDGKDHVAILHG
ncbi:MAG: GTP cyclohydrolase II, partial [Planctomycetia bacterium]|nr:GTP cyclohydrolase II [Planctomycetia bacterium]